MMTHAEIKELLKNKEIEAWKKLKESRAYGNLPEAEKWIKAIEIYNELYNKIFDTIL